MGSTSRYASERMMLTMWSAPRSRSTAFERMMMERGDFTVLHEPFSHVMDFGSATVLDRQVTSEKELLSTLKELPGRVFFKDTTDFHYPELLNDKPFLRDGVHTFIIRDPREVIESHAHLNPAVSRDDIGFARLHEIYDAVAEATGEAPVVIDSDDLIDRPADTVAAYCARVGIPFDADALRWQPGTPRQWQRTERWHEAAAASSGFSRPPRQYARTVDNDPQLAEYHRYHQPYHQKLWEQRLRLA
ncbi:hypothetical protein [Micromonospora tulbaghiae]|uniref:sulfotransferase-like domain-containing protein n=1 Tax=Micromonospora tulbaghiae TaxID=479978 RepID=UPI0029C5B164|nr:hypothetical protein [Micromonospora tulbaghiae]MDX5461815.1 hypothetical protein [Micromonospora tulbaghiae]